MDEDEMFDIIIRGWALHCATAGVNYSVGEAMKRAQRFENYLRTGKRIQVEEQDS